MRYTIYAILAGIFLGSIGLFVNLIGSSVHPMVLNFYRVFFAMLVLLIIVPFFDNKAFNITKTDLKSYLFIGFIIAVSLSIVNLAYQSAPMQNVVFIISLNPVFVFLFAYILLKESITKTKIITLGLAIIGLFIINPVSGAGGLGNLIAILAALTEGFLIVMLRYMDKNHSFGDIFWFFLFASIFLLPMPFIYGFGAINISVVLLGILSTGLAYLFYNLALTKLESEVASIIVTIIAPITGVLLAIFALGDAIYTNILVGGAILVLAGMYLEVHKLRLK